ncbi:CPBP family intramembrane glutamic endopeptidase [Clostridium tetani]|uniref:Membrane spanning protein n=1 Tax=Clostridium tetani (strain Massachusetts / E88) TaxID=212717 RepID=Q894V6_CLOTE|nr:type II CAAX endopeptidase family protein [Clostridium tetani]AAO35986.1 membrane spanning protein [Clostridium tetani E88]AVP55204.1 CPBP family intramembrane metalloprotease [Clostridium tetani]KGI38074.1 CAAX protease [Clostridium tetani]KGI41476.1 CAAX protease [Clostridium tetani]KGI43165.1 CAAX protease [Clostridium tetani]
MNKYNISSKDLTLFFIITFGLTISMGIVMAIASSYGFGIDTMGNFALIQMYYPSIGVMIALLLNSEKRKELPIKFYVSFLFFTITSIIYLLVSIFVFHKDADMGIQYWTMFGSIIVALMYFTEKKERIDNFGLRGGKNVKKSIAYIFLFLILYICTILLESLIFGGFKESIAPFKNLKTLINIFWLPLLFPLSFLAFLGEEYGWRYFLQTALQERIGKKGGVIFLGFIWGIWHLPLNMFFYSPKTSFYSILNQLIVCTAYAIFFGFVYMKTENVWTVSMIHFLNNSLAFIIYGSTGSDIVLSIQLVLGSLICMCIVYLPFLFTKEYKKQKQK